MGVYEYVSIYKKPPAEYWFLFYYFINFIISFESYIVEKKF